MKDFLAKVEAAIKALRERANTALSTLPPLEQIEGGEQVLSALRCMQYMRGEVEDLAARFENVDQLLTDLTNQASEAAVADGLENGLFVKKEEHDAMLDTAKETGRNEANQAVADAQAVADQIAGRRAEAVEAVGEVAAGFLTDEVLGEDNYLTTIAAMKSRLATVNEAGLTVEAHEKAFKVLAGVGFGEAGDKDFTSKLEAFKSIITPSADPNKVNARRTAAHVPAPDNTAAPKKRTVSAI